MKKKIVSLSLAFCLVIGLTAPTFAASNSAPNTTDEITVDETFEGVEAANIVAELKRDGTERGRNQITEPVLSTEDQTIIQEFDLFMSRRAKSINTVPTEADIQLFIEYAVDNGIIEDTPQSRATANIVVMRASMRIVAAAGGALGLKMSEALLKHSLQNRPPKYTMNRGTTYSNQVKNSSAHYRLMTAVRTRLRSQSGTLYSQSGSVTFNSSTDLSLALNRASYILGAEKINGRWDVYVRYYDVYDFAPSAWRKLSLSGVAADALNEYGYICQQAGAVVPYSIQIYTLNSY